MYEYEWDVETGGYVLTVRTGRFVANEVRPVFAEELELTGLGKYFDYDREEKRPLLWAQKNAYYYRGEKIAQCKGTRYGKPMEIELFGTAGLKLFPVDIESMIDKNRIIMRALIDDTKRRTKELYDLDIRRCDKAYIAFSGGKDSIALLHLCDEVLPLDVPVIFSDTDMELPDTYKTWEMIKTLYPQREFIVARAHVPAIENWRNFGPPSRTIRWCCSIHKSTPALIELKRLAQKDKVKVMAFVGVRGEESISRSFYEDKNDGIKNASQMNRMPLLDWGSHELWLYIFQNNLYINRAYRLGLPRVGCAMCPESSEKYVWLVNAAYPGLINPYVETIVNTGTKTFANNDDVTEYIAKQGWQARKSGVILKNSVTAPIEIIEGNHVTFKSSFFDETNFFTWIKPLGSVVWDADTNETKLKIPHSLDDGIPFEYRASFAGGGTFSITFRSEEEMLSWMPIIRALLKKTSSCIACRACEAECTQGAISYVNGRIEINEDRCVHCRKCYDNIDNSCWRYKSMYKSENDQKKQMSGINRYNNFGLREKDQNLWVSALVEMGEEFFPWNDVHPLGKKMVEAASAWFQQSELVDNKTRKPTLLAEMFKKKGGDFLIGWDFIWMALANNAPLIKWFVTSTRVGETYSVEQLSDKLKLDYPELGDNTIKGGLSALKDMISKSPIGDDGDEAAMVLYELKGKSVSSVTRLSRETHPLVLLYGLYLIARISDNSAFTVAGLMDADTESAFVSPLVVFGISAGDFKRACDGLHTRYPDYIATTFTHGNDEVRIFPEKFSTSDVIDLALKEV